MSGVVNVVKDTFFGGAEKKAAQAQERTAQQGIAAQERAAQMAVEEQRRQFDITREDLQPFLQAGTGALAQQQALLGLSGPEAAQAAMAQFQESPGQKFLRERQERALLRNQAAIGGLGGGNVRTALQEQAAGIAATQFGDFQNQLAALSGTGQTTGTSLGQFGSQAASNIGNIQTGTAANVANLLGTAGAARASGILGRNEAIKGTIQGGAQALGMFSDIRLKENVKKVGELSSGLSVYTWDWKEDANEIVGNQPAFGVIAQEVAGMFPEMVREVNGYLTVNYEGLK